MEKIYLSGRLEFNSVNNSWYLIDLAGPELLASDAGSFHALRQFHGHALDPRANPHSIAHCQNSFAANLSANSSHRINAFGLGSKHYVTRQAASLRMSQSVQYRWVIRIKMPDLGIRQSQ